MGINLRVQCENSLVELESLLNGQVEDGQVKEMNVDDLKKKIGVVKESTISVFEEYSKKGKLDDLKDLIQRIRLDFKDVNKLLTQSKTEKAYLLVFPEELNQEELKNELLANLDELEGRIKDLENYKMVVEHFSISSDSTFPEKCSHFKEEFLEFFFSFLTEKLRRQIFIGYNRRFNEKQNALINKNNKKIEKLDDLIKKIEGEIASGPLAKKKAKLEAKKAELLLQKAAIEENNNSLKSNLEEKQKKGLETRQLLHSLGGEGVKLHNKSENVTLDGIYISSDTFRKTLQNAGAQMFAIKLGTDVNDKSKQVSLEGLVFTEESLEQETVSKLDQLGFFNGEEGLGFHKVYYQSKSTKFVLLVADDKFQELKRLNLVDYWNYIIPESGTGLLNSIFNWFDQGEEFHNNIISPFELKQWDFDSSDPSQQSQGGTVLLTSGNAGVYEMHKYEMLNFLLNGMNVMAINFRGYGESTGYPTANGFKRDMETAYQYLRDVKRVEDNKLLLKALCISGGAAADLASRHPEINLLLDQTYSNFDALVKDTIQDAIQQFLRSHQKNNPESDYPEKFKERAIELLKWANENYPVISHVLSKLISPAWSVTENIGKVKGHIGLIHSTNDDLVQFDQHVLKNYTEAMTNCPSVTYIEIIGEHATAWAGAQKNDFEIKFPSDEKIRELVESRRKARLFLADFEPFEFVEKEVLEARINDLRKAYPGFNPSTLRNLQSVFINQLTLGIEELNKTGQGASDDEIRAFAKDFLQQENIPEVRAFIAELPENSVDQTDFIEFLLSSFTRKDLLTDFYKEVKEWYVNPFFFGLFTQRNAANLNAHINQRLEELPYPESVKAEISMFIALAIPNAFALWMDDALPKKPHKAGVQIVQFLKNSRLSEPLVVFPEEDSFSEPSLSDEEADLSEPLV